MSGSLILSRSRPKPLMIYDGDCGFCKKWIDRWHHATGEAVEYAPSQSVAPEFPEIPLQEFDQEVKLVTVEGRVYGGAAAVFRSLNLGAHPGFFARLALSMYQRVLGFAPVAEASYRFVARHRSFFSAATRWL